jgi:hypothetical protein
MANRSTKERGVSVHPNAVELLKSLSEKKRVAGRDA